MHPDEEQDFGWFSRLMGFVERGPEHVRQRLALEGSTVRSLVNGAALDCGWLETPRLDELRALSRALPDLGPSCVSEVVGDVGAMHRDPRNAGALFQAASQFNLLEMVGPSVTPEQGLGIYSSDKTQGPACAIACGGGTIYRNYFAPVGGGLGQTADRQIDCLADLGAALGSGHYSMRNGYALASRAGLEAIGRQLSDADAATQEQLRGLLRVGIQHDVQVVGTNHRVTQIYGSALPVAYREHGRRLWEPFARLVLEASYEATLLAAAIWQPTPVYLTLLGGGAFGNDDVWIEDAVVRAVERVRGLDIRIVSYGGPKRSVSRILQRCQSRVRPQPGRTSKTHPIRVDTVALPGGPPIGMTFAPGKVQHNAQTGTWRRSLEADLARLSRHHGVDELVCLVEDHELEQLHIPELAARCAAHGITLHRLPIRDRHSPDKAELQSLLRELVGLQQAGRRVVFHCMGGLGRAGTAAACCLIETGMAPEDAIRTVRTARPGTIETSGQLAFVLEYGQA